MHCKDGEAWKVGSRKSKDLRISLRLGLAAGWG